MERAEQAPVTIAPKIGEESGLGDNVELF
jgi:hypothetical protein